jgi:glycosyltransferase involved in cell wall biosynthesis
VIVMPSVVEPEPDANLSRRDFDLPEQSCLYLLNFDASSVIARKNPFGAIDAFRSAFSRDEAGATAHLVIKTMNLARWPEAEFELRRRVARVGGIVIDEELTSRETASLTMNCDVFVSLHRAEGFGLGMAEAMYFGIPAIATRYSGSEDFLRTSNSCGVGYRMANVRPGDLRFNPHAESVYVPGMRWAEPHIAQATKWMRLLYERPEFRRHLGESAAETIRTKYSSDVAGLAMRARLEEILA